MFLLVVVIIIAIVFFVYHVGHQHDKKSSEDKDAEEILLNRFIDGEIDEEAYKKMVHTLRS